MLRDTADLLREALALPPEERVALADSLLESIEPVTDSDAEAAWSKEIQRRMREIDEDSVDLLPWDEVRRRLRDRLGK